ncbi:MAG: FeoA family protein [Pseudomonadales bacterium]
MSVALKDLQVGDSARVTGYAERSAYAERLMHLGLIPGTRLRLQRRAPLGDPLEIRFRGYSLALRPDEASCLLLERE